MNVATVTKVVAITAIVRVASRVIGIVTESVIVAAVAGRVLEVTLGGEALDPQSWAHISQRGSLAEVVAFLDQQNLAEVDLEPIAWRLRDRAAYDAILGALERRRVYSATLWGYALFHRDAPRIHIWARALGDTLLAAGPVLDMAVLGLDAEALDGYEHLELAPLIKSIGMKVQ